MTATQPDESVYRAAAEQLNILRGHQRGTPAFDLRVANDANSPGLRLIVDTTWRLARPVEEPVSSRTQWAIRTIHNVPSQPAIRPIVDAGDRTDETMARAAYRRGVALWGSGGDVERVELVKRKTLIYADDWERTSPWTVVDTTKEQT